MVDLMQKAAGREVFSFVFVPVAVPVLRADLRVLGSCHKAPLAGKAEAPFNAGLLFLADLDDLGVHKLPVLTLGVHDHHAAQDANLRSGQPRAVRVVERFDHVVNQLRKAVVKFGNRAADLGKHRVSDRDNVAKCHKISPQSYEFTSAYALTPRFCFSFANARRLKSSSCRRGFPFFAASVSR